METLNNHGRLAAIDVLRGFDMFFLVGAGDVLRNFFSAMGADSQSGILYQLNHTDWIGFTAWDIIMPLFLFTSGLSMPFSFGKFLQGKHSKRQLYVKVLKRFALLFLLGWIAQGNLLDLTIDHFHIYCNTLHAIAFGYLITAFLVLNISNIRWLIVASASLLIVYWLCMTFIPVSGFGSGVFTPEGNLAIHIDHAVFRALDDGTQYTWMLTSLSFAATVISGYFAGYVLKRSDRTEAKLKMLAIIGVALIAGGLLWSLQMPVIKKIWSCSMVLFSSGVCYLLLALSLLLTDKMKLNGWWITGLRVFGLNSITAYMLYEAFGLRNISKALLHGFEQYTGDFYPAIIALGEFSIIWLILYHMYRYKIFLKV